MFGLEQTVLILSVVVSVCTVLFAFYRTVSAPQKERIKINKDLLARLEGRIERQERDIMSAVEDIDSKLFDLEKNTATRREVEYKLQILKDDLKQDINKLDAKLDSGFESLRERLDRYFLPKK